MPFVARSLAPCIADWISIGASDTIIDWIVNGVPVSFSEAPPSFELPNYKLSDTQVRFIDGELQALLSSGAVVKAVTKPLCVSPLGVVPKKQNKLRLILDLRQLNRYCSVEKFQYEDIRTALELVEPHDIYITADLKNGFHHVPIRACDQKYFGFVWRNQYYVWRVLPFGWKASPFFFHKTVRAVITYLRVKGVRITSYVDDFLLLSSEGSIDSDKRLFLDTLARLGWQLSTEKCCLTPTAKIEYIGFVLDTTAQDGTPCLRVPTSRVRKVRKDLARLLASECFSARRLAVILGQCVSMAKAILPAKLLLRNAYQLLSTRHSWDAKAMVLNAATRKDLTWWVQSLQRWNGLVHKHRPNAIQISTDASGSGWGGHLYNHNLSSHGHWDKSMKLRASNYREIMAVYLSLRSFAPFIKGSAVTVLSDNVTTTAYLNHMGGPRHAMSMVAQAVWALAHKLDISLSVRYLAGKENQIADRLSRLQDRYEWRLHPGIFHRIDQAFGPHTVDRFASLQSTQLRRYNSAFHDPAAEAVDALSQDWTGEVNFVNAPFRLLPRILRLIKDQGVMATVVAPYWPSQTWFHRLQEMAIAMPIKIPNSPKTIQRLSRLPEPLNNRKWRLHAWKVCGQSDYKKKASPRGLLLNFPSAGPTVHGKPITDSYNALKSFVIREADHFMA